MTVSQTSVGDTEVSIHNSSIISGEKMKTRASHSVSVSVSLSMSAQSSLEFVSLGRRLYAQLFGNETDVMHKMILVRFIGSSVLSTPKVFPVTVKTNLPHNMIEIESLKYLQKYSGDFSIVKAVIRRIDKIPPLDHIIASFPPEVYDILKDKSSEFIHRQICEERESSVDFAVIRTGDISHTLNGEILFTEPYEQGYINTQTAITIVKANGCHSTSINELTSQEQNFDDFDPFNFDDISNSMILNGKESIECEFNVSTLQLNTLKENTMLDQHSSEFWYEDEMIYMCLTLHDFQKLQCLSGEIVKISSGSYDFLGRIFPFVGPCSFKPNSIYISPLLALTLSNPKRIKISKLRAPNKLVNGERHRITKFIPLAKEVTIARVSTPVTTDKSLQHLFMLNLKKYFESAHRVISFGQLIPIALDSSLARSIYETYSNKNRYPDQIPYGQQDCIAWFQITGGSFKDPNNQGLADIEPGKQYFVNAQRTRMIQSGIVCSDLSSVNIPNISSYLNIQPLFQFPNIYIAPNKVTFPYAKKLRKIFETATKTRGKLELQTIVMLTSNTRFVGKSTLLKTVCNDFGYSFVELNGHELLNSGLGMPAATVGIIRGKVDRLVESCERLVILIKHIESICKKGDEQQLEQKSVDDTLSMNITQLVRDYAKRGVIVVFTSKDADNVSDILRSKVKFEIDVGVPNEPERKEIFKYLVDTEYSSKRSIFNNDGRYKYVARSDVNIDNLALQSAALTANDLNYIVKNVKLNALNRLRKESKKLEISLLDLIELNGSSVKLISKDFEESINRARNKFSDSIGAPRIPNVKWEDVGGLDVVKSEILDTIEMPLKHPELFGSGMKKRSGLLFYGPPGTGKTLLAKAIATNFSLNFFSVKGPELLNMYIGESEANVRRVFEKARDAKPCVIFFDELDSVAPRRGNQGDSGGVMDRIVSQLLAELDGMSGSDNGDGVFVVGASNRPDLLDEALLRPGRFDKMLYLGISDTHEKQAKIIEALSRKFKLHPNIDLLKIAESCPFNFTGADFYALCSDAMLNAIIRTAGDVDRKLHKYNETRPEEDQLNLRQWFDKVATESDMEVLVSEEDFAKARLDLVASVSEEELKHYLRVRENFEGGKN